ncbi:hypothetical protein F5Y10DRAFT_255015 [Nemania abortiva]|nr:hypothetical protein F5Y10DRAFT_255015 [Nemania abortiva]
MSIGREAIKKIGNVDKENVLSASLFLLSLSPSLSLPLSPPLFLRPPCLDQGGMVNDILDLGPTYNLRILFRDLGESSRQLDLACRPARTYCSAHNLPYCRCSV